MPLVICCPAPVYCKYNVHKTANKFLLSYVGLYEGYHVVLKRPLQSCEPFITSLELGILDKDIVHSQSGGENVLLT